MERQPPVPPGDTFAAYQEQLRRGHQALGQGEGRAALEAYRAAAALADERALPHVLVGRALLVLGRTPDALAAFERALERAGHDPSALAGKAEALLRLGRREDAAVVRRQLEQAASGALGEAGDSAAAGAEVALLPRAEVLTIAAEQAWQDGRAEAALGEWLAAARVHAADGHVDAALDICQRALIADSGASAVHLEMSRLYLAAGLTEQAVERILLLGRLLELEPSGELRAELAALAHRHSGIDPRLAEMADRLGKPAPA